MKTDLLIAELARDAAVQPVRPARVAIAILAIIACAVAVFLNMSGLRAGWADSLRDPVVSWKTWLPAFLCLFALSAALRLMRPQNSTIPGLRAVLVVLASAAALLYAAGLFLQPPALWFADLGRQSILECLVSIIAISLPALALALLIARQGATTEPKRLGAVLGAVVAAGATAGYSLYCTQDNPIFFVTWYGLAIGIVTLAGAYLGARTLRW